LRCGDGHAAAGYRGGPNGCRPPSHTQSTQSPTLAQLTQPQSVPCLPTANSFATLTWCRAPAIGPSIGACDVSLGPPTTRTVPPSHPPYLPYLLITPRLTPLHTLTHIHHHNPPTKSITALPLHIHNLHTPVALGRIMMSSERSETSTVGLPKVFLRSSYPTPRAKRAPMVGTPLYHTMWELARAPSRAFQGR